jgi:FHA domain
MDILGKARRLESRLAKTLDDAVQNVVGRNARQPIEVLHAVIDAAEQQVQPAGRGRRVFPFNRMIVHIAAASRSERARFAALADEPSPLRERVIDRLRASGCDARDLDLEIDYAPKAKAGWMTPEYHVEFDRVEKAPAPAPPPPGPAPRLDLVVAAGSASRRSYTFTGGRVDIGRRAEVLDHRHRLVRTNHIAFDEESGDVNKTVSRKHAHIIYSAAAHEYRLRDDGSAHGTAVLRNGHTVPVPQGSRGARLQSGDEIVLGQAKLKVKIEPADR